MNHFYRKENGEWKETPALYLYRKENGKWVKIELSDLNVAKYRHETLESKVRYVSMGDSIAVGHRIDENWEKNYGWDAQYGVDGRTETTIVPGCYTDLIRNELVETYGANRVILKSFAKSGDTVADLMEKLNHETVRNALNIADLVTICIGANDVLHYALVGLPEYLNTGDLSTIDAQVDASLKVLDNDSAATSYLALLNKLLSVNAHAKYVFTTVYNPYKYLWIDGGKNGFFYHLLNNIPQMTIAGFELDELIKDGILNTPTIKNFVTRVNGMGSKAEEYVTRLNSILRNKITAFQISNPKFYLADSKAVFDPVPDRPIAAPNHYNDLVNVEYTRGYDIAQVNWGALWANSDVGTFWWNLATKYFSTSSFTLDINGLASELMNMVIEKVIEPDIDPHPEHYGHHALRCSFADALGWDVLPRRTITFNANGGAGTMSAQVVVALDGNTAYTNINALRFTPGAEGYYFTGWNTAVDGSGIAYTDGQFIGLAGNLTLYAQWSNIYTVTFRHSKNSNYHGSSDTGPMERYALWIDGTEQADLGAFSNPARTYRLPYGTPLGVIAAVERGSDRSYVTWNGAKVSGNSNWSTYDFLLTGDVDIHFEWNYWLNNAVPQSYWNCYITTN
jgi:uncharacterized repeat protein (TIGR02543 family)